ncbi:MAG: HlyD family secretion protein [Bosea sp. (in: a-proteobacteria)]
MANRSAQVLVAAVLLLLGPFTTLTGRAQEAPARIVGMVRQTEVRLSPMTSGRLASIAVTPGQRVSRGDVLAVLDNPELVASVAEAQAAVASVRAERDRVYAGVRAEEIAIAEQALQNAQANLHLAEQMNARAVALVARSVASRARLDESDATLARARADLDVKTSQLGAAKAGPVAEERAVVDGRLTLAMATLADLNARLDKTKLIAPMDGTISLRVAELGEIIPPGKPVLTMVAERARWFGFTLREDLLQGISMGQTVSVQTPDGSRIEARVTELRPLGEFATWRAARAIGDHDLNSFRLRLDPVGASEGLEAGMTVWLQRGR